MAINRIMMAALKALSYPDIDISKTYKLERGLKNLMNPAVKILYDVWDHKICVDGYEVPVRVFLPEEERSREVILFFHGGGWVTGNIDNYTATCNTIANEMGRRVLSVDYRLAPEYPFPRGLLDCYAVAKELYLDKSLMGVSEEEIILMGDSAGGNLAAAVSLMAKDKGEFSVRRQVLLYPSTGNDHTEGSIFPSIKENGKDYLLTSKRICEYIDLYLQDKKDYQNPYFAPLLAIDLTGQPETLILTAEFDPLRDEGEAYGEKLRSFGVEVEVHRMPDMLHGFFQLPLTFETVKESYQIVSDFLDGVESHGA